MIEIEGIRSLLDKDMNRREFIAHMGMISATLFGITRVISIFSGSSEPKFDDQSVYSYGVYGGEGDSPVNNKQVSMHQRRLSVGGII